MAVPNVPFNQLPKEAQRRIRRENPDAFPLKDTRPARDIDTYSDKPSQPVKKSTPPPAQKPAPKQSPPPQKSRWESVKERILGNKDEKKERKERRPERAEPRGRISSKSIYKDGKLVEKIHYGPAHPPAQKQPKPKPQRRRGDPLGGLGAGMKMSDFLPSNQGYGLGGMMAEPYGAPQAPRPRKGKKGRRPSREQLNPMSDDFLDRMYGDYPKPWKGKF